MNNTDSKLDSIYQNLSDNDKTKLNEVTAGVEKLVKDFYVVHEQALDFLENADNNELLDFLSSLEVEDFSAVKFGDITEDQVHEIIKAKGAKKINLFNSYIVIFDRVLLWEHKCGDPHNCDDTYIEGQVTISDIDKTLPVVSITKNPDEALMLLTKAQQKAFSGEILYNKPINVRVSPKGKGDKVTTVISLDIKALEKRGGAHVEGRKLNAIDYAVHDAVISLWANGTTNFTIDMVYRAMIGNTSGKPTDDWRKRITESIEDLSDIKVSINATDEIKKYYNGDVEEYIFKGAILPLLEHTIVMHGKTVKAYTVQSKPPFYYYADMNNQIGRMDMRVLNTPVNKDLETVILQNILRRKILALKGNPKKFSHKTIKYSGGSGVFDEMGDIISVNQKTGERRTPEAERKKKTKLRAKAKKILDHFVNEGFIRGYSDEKTGNTIDKIKIDF